jgi:hypothetical protein
MLTQAILAALAITLSLTPAAVLAEERSAAQLPGLSGVVVAAVVAKSAPQTDHAHAAPPSCPYHFDSDMPPATFCVYRGVALGSSGEVCAADVVVIWSSASAQSRGSVVPADKGSYFRKRNAAHVPIGEVEGPVGQGWRRADFPSDAGASPNPIRWVQAASRHS